MTTPAPKRRFEYKSDRSYKFWSVEQNENIVKVTYGRIGNRGTSKNQEFTSSKAAIDFVATKIREKLKAGYKEVIPKVVERKSNAQLWAELQPHKPFIQTILESPDNEEAYLVYADWLMEQGDPRGEFILCQWKIEDYQTPLREIEAYRKRSQAIHSEHWQDWLGEAASLIFQNLLAVHFSRGFVDRIVVSEPRSELAKQLLDSPHTRLARQLSLLNTTPPSALREDFFRGLNTLAQVDFGNIRHFSPGKNVGPNLAQPVFELIQSMPRLEKLTLHNSFQEPDLQNLFQLEIPKIEELTVSDSNGDATIFNLCRSDWLEQLRTIELDCNCSDSVCQRLAESLDPIQTETLYVSSAISEVSINLFEKQDINVIPQ